MFSATAKPTSTGSGSRVDHNQDNLNSTDDGMELPLELDYYRGDFVEDGSFLVLNTDGLSISPSTPPGAKSDGGDGVLEVEDKNLDIEVVNGEDGFETPSASITKSQVLGEDPESSVDSSHSRSSMVKQEIQDNASASSSTAYQTENVLSSMTNMSVVSASSASTDANLIESGEEVNLLMAENKKLAELLADSNEKMKQCITTTEKLKADHEEYKRKHETSRELINQLRQDNETLRSQLAINQRSDFSDLAQNEDKDKELAAKQESLQRHYHTISELNERLKTVLTVNGQLNDQLLSCQKENEVMRTELEVLRGEHELQMTAKSEAERKIEVMTAEIDSGRQTIAKFKERHVKYEDELAIAKTKIQNLEDTVEEKTKLIENLRRNMEDTVTALERCNYKLNQKEQEISLLTTKLAAIRAETESNEQLQVLQVQCQTYLTDFQKVSEERVKLVEEKEALSNELIAVKQQLQEKSNALNILRQHGTSGEQTHPDFLSRNDNSAANANESLPSPLTSLPSVAGQLVGFVRRELLGWEEQSSAGASDATQGNSEAYGSSETVVQQPKQEAIPPCPICRKAFPSLERLQTHASNCGIENDEQPDDPFVFPVGVLGRDVLERDENTD